MDVDMATTTRKATALGVATALLLWPGLAAAQDEGAAEGTIGIELNRADTSADGCRTFLVIDNRSGHDFNAFRLELVLFDPAGVVHRQLLFDMAPLRDGKRTVASFVLEVPSCAAIGSILINDVPLCQARGGDAVDCLALIVPASRTVIPLTL
jgi:hypothetical protein